MAFLFTTPQKKENIIAIFDIGSGSVGAAITRMPDNDKNLPTIIASERTSIVARDPSNLDMFMEDMLKALKETVKKISANKVAAPTRIECVLASPWYVSETRVVKLAKDSPFIFNKRTADELFHTEVEAVKASFKNKYGENNGPEVIEHQIMGVLLNGYAVAEPIGVRSKAVEMHMLISISPKECLDQIREAVAHELPHVPLAFSSFALSSFIAVRDRFVIPDSYFLMDVGGEVTDVAIVTKGILKASLSFPFGKETFFRELSLRMKIDDRGAEELFTLYATDTLAIRRKKKAEPIFKDIEKSWGEAFRACIGALPHTLTLPNTVFLTADLDVREWFANMIKNEPYISSTSFGNTSTVVTLEGPEFLSMCSIKDSTCDPFLMIEAISLARKMV